MWCPHCQADLASEISADGQSLLCTSCNQEVRKVYAPSLHPETQSARELLSRWASEDLFATDESPSPSELPTANEPPSREKPQPPTPSATQPRTIKPNRDEETGKPTERPETTRSPGARPSQSAETSRPKFRIDSAHPPDPASARGNRPAPRRPELATPAGFESEQESGLPAYGPRGRPLQANSQTSSQLDRHGRRHDSAHALVGAPHIDIQHFARPDVAPGKGESLWGQLLAYAGVAVLTVGTVLVLWGHFGGISNYSSTGWLVATGGQMLLMLGVVTLVSGGMQQTTHEVTERVQYIGERMIRIEQSTQDILRGPHFNRPPSGSRTSAAHQHEEEEETA